MTARMDSSMSTGRLSYAYRLTSARLVILRMRFKRYIQRHLLAKQTSSPRKGFSRTAGLLGLCLCLCLAFLAIAGPVAKRWTTVPTSKALAANESVNSVDAVDQGVKQVQHEQLTTLNSKIDVLMDKTRELEATLILQRADNATLTELIEQRNAELASIRRSARHQSVQLEELKQQHWLLQGIEDEKLALEQQLLEKDRLLAEARTQTEKVNTEHKVVYNITNIPVGTHVSEEQIRNDIQSVAEQGAPRSSFAEEGASEILPSDDQEESLDATQSFTYPFGANPSDVNGVDPYQQYRDTSGESAGWKGDRYLADMLEGEAEVEGGLEDIESFLQSEPESVILLEDPIVRVPVREPASGKIIVHEEPFFGPAADRYENLLEPGMAELPGEAQSLDQR